MTTTASPTRKVSGVALFNMPYLYQARDPEFHMAMLNLGLWREAPLCCREPYKAIVADKHSYWLTDYANEEELCREYDLVPTYTVEDFVAEIKKLQEYEK